VQVMTSFTNQSCYLVYFLTNAKIGALFHCIALSANLSFVFVYVKVLFFYMWGIGSLEYLLLLLLCES